MGFRSGLECKATAIEVAQELCATSNGISSAGYVQCVGITPVTMGYAIELDTVAPGGGVTHAQVQVPGLPCDENERINDMTELFGLGLVAVLGVFLLKEFVVRHVMPQ